MSYFLSFINYVDLPGFLVQLRSLDDHSPLPGITIGDIGAKLGYNTMDNGVLQFDHVCIPRDQMLMRLVKYYFSLLFCSFHLEITQCG